MECLWHPGRLHGCLLVWDATCPDTFVTSYRTYTIQEAGKDAENAEDRKVEKYQGLPASHSFTLITIETMGAISLRSMAFLREMCEEIGQRLREVRGDTMEQQLVMLLPTQMTIVLL